jgi:hypothetical protein
MVESSQTNTLQTKTMPTAKPCTLLNIRQEQHSTRAQGAAVDAPQENKLVEFPEYQRISTSSIVEVEPYQPSHVRTTLRQVNLADVHYCTTRAHAPLR